MHIAEPCNAPNPPASASPAGRWHPVIVALVLIARPLLAAAPEPPAFLHDPKQPLERTCFQTSRPYSDGVDLRSDVAIAYGIDPGLPGRMQSWKEHGYRVHVMTGIAWGNYQDYLHGQFDGIHHEDEEQTDRNGVPHSHGGDVYYMCPSTNYGRYICRGVQRALDAGTEAIDLEEPEFWVQDGYSAGFKREWKAYYGEAWRPPHESVDAQWRASKLKYFLYRRALQQVFDYVQAYNRRTGRHVRCYVPTHSLLNYATWRIVSPESSLARLKGCDGYIAQVWTGTARTPNVYRGVLRERTFETAFLEYGAMQNLVRSTGRSVWYLNDPIEDNPDHDWNDYRQNWQSTLTASLFQPAVWQYEVAPWPERVFGGRYPASAPPADRKPIPAAYATELQIVFNALNDMHQTNVAWSCGTPGIGVLVSDSLMFERGDPDPSDPHLGQIYGMALPLLKRGIPITPVQLENVTIAHYLDGFRLLLLTYEGMKPLSPGVHEALARWVRRGGALLICDDEADPFNSVREWWNSAGLHYATPLDQLFEQLGFSQQQKNALKNRPPVRVGHGSVAWLPENPARLAANPSGDQRLAGAAKESAATVKLPWKETNYLLLRRGPYLVAAGLDESIARGPKILRGRFVDLFDAGLRVQRRVAIEPGTRYLLLDLDRWPPTASPVLASACKALLTKSGAKTLTVLVEGAANTPGIVLMRAPAPPRSIRLAGEPLKAFEYSAADRLLWIHFANQASPRELEIDF